MNVLFSPLSRALVPSVYRIRNGTFRRPREVDESQGSGHPATRRDMLALPPLFPALLVSVHRYLVESWSRRPWPGNPTAKIVCATLDGTEIEALVEASVPLTGPTRIAFDVELPRFGACCNESTGTCTDDVLMQECVGNRQTWTKDARCEPVSSRHGPVRGRRPCCH